MTCASCGRVTCLHSDPVYAGITPLGASDFFQKRVSDGETDAARRKVHRAGVHADPDTVSEAYHHVH